MHISPETSSRSSNGRASLSSARTRNGVFGFIREFVHFGKHIVFVVAAPEDDAGVVAQALDVLTNFGFSAGEEEGIDGVGAAAHHHILRSFCQLMMHRSHTGLI